MADMEENLWKIQEYGTTWKDKGLYHVTITIPDRQRILGNLIIPNGDPQQAIIKSTPLGRAILNCQRAVQEHYPEIQILHYRLMPDHLHAIWFVKRSMNIGIMSAVRGYWQGIKKIGRAYSYLSSVLPNTIRKNTKEIVPPSCVCSILTNNKYMSLPKCCRRSWTMLLIPNYHPSLPRCPLCER